MSVSSLLIRIIFLAVPGILSYMLFRKLTGRIKREKWEECCQIILFSLMIYGTYSVLVWLYGLCMKSPIEVAFFKAVLDENVAIEWGEIVIVSLLAVPIAFVASAIHTYKLLNTLGRLIRVTRRFGDEDIWDYFHNLPDIPEYEWVLVRDHKINLLYFGWIEAYSESYKDRELLMGDVSVYDNDSGKPLYDVERLYFCRDKYDITIEIPKIDDEQKSKETS
ncbi:MAG: hypothetical protein ACFFCW_36895 [Candidatus Hodarchaeota archaeon]